MKYIPSLKIILVAAMAILLMAPYGCVESEIDYANAEPEVTLKAKRLYRDFSSNAELANEKYTGKIVQIEGKLSRLELQGDSVITIIYNYNEIDDNEKGIRVTMLPEQTDKAKSLSKRHPVLIKGLCMGFDSTNVVIEKGSLAK
jgi:hypothetical protein